MTTRKQYKKEFKMDAVSLVLEQGYKVAEAARSLDINVSMLGRWIKEHQNDEGQAFRGNGKLTPEQEEIRRLKGQVKRLEMEKDIPYISLCHARHEKSSWESKIGGRDSPIAPLLSSRIMRPVQSTSARLSLR